MENKYKSRKRREIGDKVYRWFNVRHLHLSLGRIRRATSSSYSLIEFKIQNIPGRIGIGKAKNKYGNQMI